MFPDSFRVLCDRFADTRSGMTSLEALRVLHISEIGLCHDACTGAQYTCTVHQRRRRMLQADFADVQSTESLERSHSRLAVGKTITQNPKTTREHDYFR